MKRGKMGKPVVTYHSLDFQANIDKFEVGFLEFRGAPQLVTCFACGKVWYPNIVALALYFEAFPDPIGFICGECLDNDKVITEGFKLTSADLDAVRDEIDAEIRGGIS